MQQPATESKPSAVQRLTADGQKKSVLDRQAADFRRDYGHRLPRAYETGDVYSPRDLSGAETERWAKAPRKRQLMVPLKRQGKRQDVFDITGINPLHLYKNYSVMSEFMLESGGIMHNNATHLRPVNQRKLAKALRRAQGLGLMPSIHRHPLILMPEHITAK
ncbi:putative 37S ribosomal protein S18 [Pseudovirgaria hyperparasitica]|uniref:Small ribosomal subunit protein bS18m n=1 Tax=Pseudovirgaria hyperparasitica TaxID=470096 RepID=A0A6A6VTB2_9PEZI|nr:putative 37S ribosomal protein S18 [Pseudovirgaria hyperparasitica]KAF2753822.1 putative 37S ribosomal protein S18 [Pseudovirgaria hyperparasitica]